MSSLLSLKAQLKSAETRNELAIQAANLGSWEWNVKTGDVLYNDLWANMLGYELDEIKPHVDGWADLLHPDEAESTARILQENIDGTTSFYINEHRLKMKSGDWLWVQARGCVIEHDADGSALRHYGIMIDINERKEHELYLLDNKAYLEEQIQIRTNELKASEEKFYNILKLAPEGILTTDSKGMVQLFNEGAQNIFGYSEDEIAGKSINLLIHDSFGKKHDQHLENFKNGEVAQKHFLDRDDILGYRKDGSTFIARISISRVKLRGEVVFAAIVNDISELASARDKMALAIKTAELANRAKTDFLANMSHELRTPLNAIIGYAQMIEQEIIGPIPVAGYKDYAGAIHSSGLHLLSLIQDILDISKIEAKEQDLHEEPIDLHIVIDACHIMVKEAVRDADIDFVISIEEGLPLLFADEKSLKQIILNLLSNAVKFTPYGGTVTLKVYLQNTENITFEVCDTGVGMNKQDLQKILLPFTQLKNPIYAKADQVGTGLGLSIVKSFADIYKAELIIDSEPNCGTCVKIIFPSERTVTEAQ